MERPKLRHVAGTCLGVVALTAAPLPGHAQTWQWNYVTRTPNTPPVSAQSTVGISGGNLRMTYTVPLQKRRVVIESCHAAINDVQNATTVHSEGRTFLLVQLKAARTATCVSGKRPAVALPTDDERYVNGVVAAINRSCCSATEISSRATPPQRTPLPKPAAIVAAKTPPAPAVAATPAVVANVTPVPSPAPPRSPTPAPLTVRDWVESDGLFSFVRVRNTSSQPLTIGDILLTDCRDVASGCGPSNRELTVDARATVTIASVTSANERAASAFRYQYRAARGNVTVVRTGSSGNAPPRRVAHMSAQELRSAEAGALAALRSPAPRPSADVFAPPRLIKRGSSRLAIGQTGTALVRLMIGENGTPQEATIVSITNPRLSAAAIETAVSSSFAPATQNGKPVAAKYVATFSFDGEDPATAAIPVWKRSPPAVNSAASAAPEVNTAVPATASPEAQPAAQPSPLPPSNNAPPTPPAPLVTPFTQPSASAAPQR